jgi:hypothetical protein
MTARSPSGSAASSAEPFRCLFTHCVPRGSVVHRDVEISARMINFERDSCPKAWRYPFCATRSAANIDCPYVAQSSRALVCERSPDVFCFGSFIASHNVEHDFIAGVQCFEPLSDDTSMMDEDILARVLGYKAKTLFIVPPFDFATGHSTSLLISEAGVRPFWPQNQSAKNAQWNRVRLRSSALSIGKSTESSRISFDKHESRRGDGHVPTFSQLLGTWSSPTPAFFSHFQTRALVVYAMA